MVFHAAVYLWVFIFSESAELTIVRQFWKVKVESGIRQQAAAETQQSHTFKKATTICRKKKCIHMTENYMSLYRQIMNKYSSVRRMSLCGLHTSLLTLWSFLLNTGLHPSLSICTLKSGQQHKSIQQGCFSYKKKKKSPFFWFLRQGSC